MAWQDRLRQGAYTSPSGTRIVFQFEDVSRAVTLRSTPFEFPGVDEAYVQQNGFSSRRYPIRVFFSGADHDIEATVFEAALLEKGVGRLEHPLYGLVPNAVPLGDITRRDDLKSAANQTVLEVEFWTTLRAIYPSADVSPRNEITAALEGFDLASAQQFGDSVDVSTQLHRSNLKGTILGASDTTSGALQGIAAATLSSRRAFFDAEAVVRLNVDVSIASPLIMAAQIAAFIRAPAFASADIQVRLDAYGLLADLIFGAPAGDPATSLAGGTQLPSRTTRIANDFHASDLFAMNAVAASVQSCVSNTFSTRPQALNAARSVQTQFQNVIAYRDPGFAALEQLDVTPAQVDTGRSYQQLHRAVAVCLGFLVEISFTLIPERRIVLDRNRTIIDLCAELYGHPDERLDFLISSNNLTGDEILELPRGRSIVYYPATT
jgi:hypothetical protein